MYLTYKNIKTPREWQAIVGMSEKEFHNLLILFELAYEKHHGVALETLRERLHIHQPILETHADCLFFVLFQLKNAGTFDLMGFAFGTDPSNAQRNFIRHLLILKAALELAETVYPKRQFQTINELMLYFQNEKDLIMDGSEFPTERPKNNEMQKKAYSGKKKHM
jgi:hypothetical protein